MRDVKPKFDFPGAAFITQGLSWFLAFVVIVAVFYFFRNLLALAQSYSGKHEGGAGKAGIGMLIALIVGSLALLGTHVFFGWAHLLHIS